MRVSLIAVLSVAVASALVSAQPQPQPRTQARAQNQAPRGTAILRGLILDASSGAPLRRAQVRLAGSGAGARVVSTDSQGRYEFRDLAAGSYRVTATKAGFATFSYGQRHFAESGTPIEIADKQVIDKIVVHLPRGSVIAGTITDEFGEPLANAGVSAMRFAYTGGVKRLRAAEGPNTRDTTDDRGQFRLFGLAPGDYVIAASVRPVGEGPADSTEEHTGYAPTYFPGVANVVEAQRVRVEIGQEQSGVIFPLVAARLVRVSGAVVDSRGVALTAGGVMMWPAVSTGAALQQTANASIDRTGQFRFTNIPPGRYLVTAFQMAGGPRGRPGGPAGPGGFGPVEIGFQEITVGAEDLSGVSVITQPGARVSGRIITDSGVAPAFTAQQVTIESRTTVPLPAPGMAAGQQVRPNADWTFTLENQFQPRVFRVNVPDGWALKQVRLNGQDITDVAVDLAPGQSYAGMDVVLTQRVSEVTGALTDTAGTAVTDATVVVFPSDPRQWTFQSRYIRAARPDEQGRFVIRGLPELDRYVVVAVQGLEDGQAGDPEFLASVQEQGTSFSLGEGEVRTIDLRFRAR